MPDDQTPEIREYDVTITYLDPVVDGQPQIGRRRVEHVAAADVFEALRTVATRAVELGYDVKGLLVERADMPTETEA